MPEPSHDIQSKLANHELVVFRDDGLYRHLRFKKRDSMVMHFDLVTWPGHLCFTGDMGTFVFRPLEDMFKFFRPQNDVDSIDFRYWAEKLVAGDIVDGARKWTPESFAEAVKAHFDAVTTDAELWPPSRKDAVWKEVKERVIEEAAMDGEPFAWAALWRFEEDGFRFRDWEGEGREWSPRFIFCCHALRWAIQRYDERQAKGTHDVTGAVPTDGRAVTNAHAGSEEC